MRRDVVRDAIGIGIAVSAFGVSYGAVSVAAGLTLAQTCALSLLMFTGASQFALVGVVGAGGSAAAGAMTALLLGSRNALYGLRLSTLLPQHRGRRAVAAQLVIDESTAMALARGAPGFWATGVAVFVFWNAGTLVGAVAGDALADPRALGLDATAPAAFLALLAPQLRAPAATRVAVLAALAAVIAAPLTPAGVPVLVAAAVAAVLA